MFVLTNSQMSSWLTETRTTGTVYRYNIFIVVVKSNLAEISGIFKVGMNLG